MFIIGVCLTKGHGAEYDKTASVAFLQRLVIILNCQLAEPLPVFGFKLTTGIRRIYWSLSGSPALILWYV